MYQIFLKKIYSPKYIELSIDVNKIINIFKNTNKNYKYTTSMIDEYYNKFKKVETLLDQIKNYEINLQNISSNNKLYDNEENLNKNYEDWDEIEKVLKKYIINEIPLYMLNNLYIANKVDKYIQHKRKSKSKIGMNRYGYDPNTKEIKIEITDKSHNTLKLRNALEYQKCILQNNALDTNGIRINISDHRLNYLPSWYDIEFYDDINRTFTSLSSGEKSVYILLSSIIYQISNIKSRLKLDHGKYSNILLLLDETDLGLHPKWQREYLFNILETLNGSSDKFNYHIIFTSHSPFIVSDLPKSNILFLQNGSRTTLNENKYTFGQNIHTLLNDSFFMKDEMMMGLFAENKIRNELIFLDSIISKSKTLEKIPTNSDDKEIEDLKRYRDIFISKINYLEKLQLCIGDEYLRIMFDNSVKLCKKIFNLNENHEKYKNKLLSMINNNPDLAKKILDDISD
jgi:hypothetical protein